MIDKIIFGIHVAIVLTFAIIPFLSDQRLLMMYSLVIPFLFYHWAINDDTCFLTQLECMFTNEPKERTFMGRVVGPVYKLSDDAIGKLLKTIMFALWFLVQWKLGNISFVVY